MNRSMLPHDCDDIVQALESEDGIIEYSDKFREYGIVLHDGPHESGHEGCDSYIVIAYCPFDGVKLPASMRNEWFSRLEKLEIDPYDTDRIPKEIQDGTWWRISS